MSPLYDPSPVTRGRKLHSDRSRWTGTSPNLVSRVSHLTAPWGERGERPRERGCESSITSQHAWFCTRWSDRSSITAGQAHAGPYYCDSDLVSIRVNRISRPHQCDSVESDSVLRQARRFLDRVSSSQWLSCSGLTLHCGTSETRPEFTDAQFPLCTVSSPIERVEKFRKYNPVAEHTTEQQAQWPAVCLSREFALSLRYTGRYDNNRLDRFWIFSGSLCPYTIALGHTSWQKLPCVLFLCHRFQQDVF